MRARLLTALVAFLTRHPRVRRPVQRALELASSLAGPFPPLRARLDALVGFDGRYDRWIARYDTLREHEWSAMEEHARSLPWRPRFSLVMPVCDPPEQFLREAIESVRAQVYDRWELCIADDASKAPHVREVLEQAAQDPRIAVVYRTERGGISAASNDAAALASGDYLGFLDHDDVLRPHALLLMATELNRSPEAALLYSDEDKLDAKGRRCEHYFKPDWNPALIRSQNYVCHFMVVLRERFEQLGGFRPEFDGSQDWDLVLRATEGLPRERIRHVPHVLYHWRAAAGSTAGAALAKPAAIDAGRRAVEDALLRAGVDGTVSAVHGVYQRVRHALPARRPAVAVVVPTTARPELLEPCLNGLLRQTSYNPLTVTLAVGRDALALPERARVLEDARRDERVRVFVHDGQPFNYSAANNEAIAGVEAPLLLLLNDDVRVIHDDWLEVMAGHVLEDGVAAVGAMLYYPNDTVQHAGVVVGLGGVAGHGHSRLLRGHPGYRGRAWLDQDLSCVTAGCMLLRRDAFEGVGGFDERLAIAFNDVDLCLRLVENGWRIVWTPAAELYHHESTSVGRHDSPARREQFERERLLMVDRWGETLLCDPHYNPNLSLFVANTPSFPPRVEYPWRVSRRGRPNPALAGSLAAGRG